MPAIKINLPVHVALVEVSPVFTPKPHRHLKNYKRQQRHSVTELRNLVTGSKQGKWRLYSISSLHRMILALLHILAAAVVSFLFILRKKIDQGLKYDEVPRWHQQVIFQYIPAPSVLRTYNNVICFYLDVHDVKPMILNADIKRRSQRQTMYPKY